ncbi:MAG: flagellar hook-associated protein 2 [Bacillota bacterium]|nr:flagellar hook-associated protein 2 [Bacillota bacterium]
MVNPVTSSSSGTITSPYSGLMRVSGLASGMDIDGMVKSLMQAEKIPLNQMQQKQQILEWQRDDYRSMNTALSDLDTTTFNGIYMQSTFNKKTVTSSDDSVVSATAVNATNNLSASIDTIVLAKPSSWVSSGPASFSGAKGTVGTTTTLNFKVTNPDGTTKNVTFNVAGTDTIDNVLTDFNNSNLGVSMVKIKLANGTDALAMSNNATGTGASIQATDATTISFMHSNLQFDCNSSATTGSPPVTNPNYGLLNTDPNNLAQDASFNFNGYKMTEKSNTFTISGVSYTLKKQGGSANISTATDVDTIFNSVKAFVDKYNDTIKAVNDKISEQRNRDYQPLTDDQKSAMTDSQVTQWEVKAKSGMLSNDSILSSGLSKMRQDLYAPVSGNDVGQYTQLSQIGITTSSNYLDNGKLVIDETTLRQKIQDDPQAIYKLFNSNGTTSNTEGLAHRLRDTLKSTMDQVTTIAGNTTYTSSQYTLGKQLTDLGTQITDFQSKLTSKENQYYNQFSQMEQAMQQANKQSAYFSSQFSSGG